MSVPLYVFVHHMCAWYLWRPEDGIESAGTGIKDSYKLLCRFWESKLYLIQQQQVLLTPELSLQLHLLKFSSYSAGDQMQDLVHATSPIYKIDSFVKM